MRRNKYNAIKVKTADHTFDSKKEHARFCELQLLAKAEEITDLHVHTRFPLVVDGQKICAYESDFDYLEKKTWIVEDVKSKATLTPLAKLKLKLFRVLYPTATLRITGIEGDQDG